MNWLDNIGNDLPQEEYIESLNVKDPEEDWLKERLGKITGSQLGKLVKKLKGGYGLSQGKMAQDLLYKIAWERFLVTESDGVNRLNVSSQSVQHGNDYELEAMQKFTEVTGVEVTPGGYRFHKHNEFFGGTPDGFIDDDTIIEVKAPWNGGNHLKTLLTGEVYNPEHIAQMQGYMLITGASKCVYITYDPDLPDGINLSIVDVERDEEMIKAIEEVVNQCIDIVKELISKTKEKL